jgi:F0F1-type ATP synthase epsilon subunit
MRKPITVKVQDAETVLFEGEVDRISSFNEVGRFDVFPMHANFISIIQQELTLFKGHEKVKEIKIQQAILKVKQDSVKIFLGIESLTLDEDKIVAQKEAQDAAKKAKT